MNLARFLLCTFSSAVLFALPLAGQTIQVSKENKTIAISATEQAEAEADTADISIGFTAYGVAQDRIYADASATSNAIIQALTGAGVDRKQIRSVAQNLSAIDPQDKRFAQGARFVFSQSWKVTTKAENAAAVLHLAITSGANDSGAIEWRLADDNALEAEAASKALVHAQAIAERMATGLHSHLGALIYSSNQLPQRTFYGATLNTESASLSAGRVNLKPLAILPDKVTRSATVYAVFALE